MLVNRAIQVKFVKPSKAADTDETERQPIDIDHVNDLVASQVFNAGVVVVGAITAVKVVDTVCKIAINLSNPLSWR